MRILHMIDSSGVYGAEVVLLNLACEQQRRGHDPIILSIGNTACGEKPLETEAATRGLRTIPHRMRDGLNLSGARDIVRIAEREGAQVLHAHGYKCDILMGALPRTVRKLPVVTTLHGWTAKRTFSKLGLYRFLDQLMLRRLDAVVIVDDGMRQIPAVRRLGPSKLHTIPNGLALESISPATPSEDPLTRQILELKSTGTFLIGGVGRLSPEKNFSMLIEAVHLASSQLPKFAAVILGDGPEASLLKKLVEQRDLSHKIILGGYVPEARKYVPLFDALVIPSLTEGLPMILLEAMAAGLPVIATRVGNIPETLQDLGLLVDPGNVTQLATAILTVARQYDSFKRTASGGPQRVSLHYSVVTMAHRYDDVYRSVMGREP